MRIRRIGLLIAVLFVAATTAAAYLWLQPRVVSFQPGDGTDRVPAGSTVRITFSRPMQPDSVTASFSIDPFVRGGFTWEGNSLVFSPEQPWPGGQIVSVRLAPGSRSAGLLSLSLREPVQWSFTVSMPSLFYLYPSDSASNLYQLDPQSGTVTQLTDGLGAVQDYSTTQDGKSIFFNTSLGNGGSIIYLLDRPDGKPQVLFTCPDAQCRYPSVSPGGDYLAYERTDLSASGQAGVPRVWLLQLPPNEGPEVTPRSAVLVGPSDHRTQQPQWSAKGLLTYYDYTDAAFVVQDVQSREVARFPSQTGIPGEWDVQGDRYVFPEIYSNEISDPNLTGLENIPSSRLLEYSLDGTKVDLTQADDVEDSSPVYMPDGSKLYFARKFLDIQRWTPGRQIWRMNADGSGAMAMTDEPYHNHYDLTWSPDGAHLAYVRFNKDALTEPPELWMMYADGSNATRLVTSGYLPQWIP